MIHGVAGSGKTMILGYRAAWLAQALEQPILVLCYNVALAAKLRQVIADRGLSAKVSVYNFHAWCVERLRLYHVDKPAPGDGSANGLFACTPHPSPLPQGERGPFCRATTSSRTG